jgi:CRISPR system Cascade subunit CasB
MPVHLGPQEEIYFLLATLYPLNDGQAPNGDFGSSFAQLRMKRESESLDRRMNILLDSDFDWDAQGRLKGGELGFRLRQAVKLLASEDIGVNWVVLLEDLLRWSHPDKYIQKRWARSYYGTVNRQAEKEA